jgi:hypothetical protein
MCSYPQCTEDLIVNFIFENYLRTEKPTYLDIGVQIMQNAVYFIYADTYINTIYVDKELRKARP